MRVWRGEVENSKILLFNRALWEGNGGEWPFYIVARKNVFLHWNQAEASCVDKFPKFKKSPNLGKTPWSCGLMHYVLDREVEGSNLAAIKFFFRPG